MPNITNPKCSKKKFLEALQNNVDNQKSAQQIADELGISRVWYYKLRHRYREEIADLAKDLAKSLAAEQIFNLNNMSKKNVLAANSLLEIARVRTKDSLIPDSAGWRITIEKIKEETQSK